LGFTYKFQNAYVKVVYIFVIIESNRFLIKNAMYTFNFYNSKLRLFSKLIDESFIIPFFKKDTFLTIQKVNELLN